MIANWTLNWGSLPDWLMAGIAGMAAWIALSQLRSAASAARDQAQIARATLILELDRDYESPEMRESRTALRSLRNEIESFTRREHHDLDNHALHEEVNRNFSRYMNLLWRDFRKADRKVTNNTLESLLKLHLENQAAEGGSIQPHEKAGIQYLRLTQILGWLERVSHLVHQGLIPKDDIFLLYDALFVEMGKWFSGHIKLRQEDGPKPNPNFMRLTLQLCAEIEEKRQAEQKQTEKIPRTGGGGVRAFR